MYVCVNLVIMFVGEAAREEAGELLLLLPLVSDSESVSFSSAWITNLGVGGSGDGRGALTGDLSRGVFRGGVSSSKWSLGGASGGRWVEVATRESKWCQVGISGGRWG